MRTQPVDMRGAFARRNPFVQPRRRGLTLLEAAMALGVAVTVMVGMTQLVTSANETTRARTTAERLREIKGAAEQYVRANKAALITATAPGTTTRVRVAKTATGGAIPADNPAGGVNFSIQGGGYLPDTFVDTNPYGQRHDVVVRNTGTAANPKLEALVIANGGNVIPDRILGQIGTYGGSSAGFVLTNPPGGTGNLVTGAQGGWSAAAAAFTSGSIAPAAGHAMAALNVAENSPSSDYLNRTDTGNAEDNTMRAPLIMGNSTYITSQTGTVDIQPDLNVQRSIKAGTTITAQGAISTGVAGDIISGRDIFSDRDGKIGRDLRVERNINSSTGNIQTDADNKGFTAAGAKGFFRTTAADGYMESHIFRDSDDKTAGGAVQWYMDPSDTSVINDVQAKYTSLNGYVYSSAYGISKSDNVKFTDLLPKYVGMYSYSAKHNDFVPKPTCKGYGEPRVMAMVTTQSWNYAPDIKASVTPSNYEKVVSAIDKNGNVTKTIEIPTKINFKIEPQVKEIRQQTYATNYNANYWQIKFDGSPTPGRDRAAVVQTYCYYP